jgi:mono/diheme cytochrome c family protein
MSTPGTKSAGLQQLVARQRSWVGPTSTVGRLVLTGSHSMRSGGRLMPLLVLVALIGGTAIGQPLPKPAGSISVWQGVYSPAQAARGEAVYAAHCSDCHSAGLNGNSAALAGQPFWDRWGEDSLESFFSVISTTMPEDAAGSLAEQDYVDVVAYLLKSNGVPSGESDLKRDSIAAVRVEGKDGPGEVPNYALVAVRGCLTQGAKGGWVLAQASGPVRTRNPEAAEANGSTNESGGNASYTLLSVYPSPAAHQGHLMEVRGFLIRTPEESRLNVTSLRMLRGSCTP